MPDYTYIISINSSNPYAAIHVRRTDKAHETVAQPVEKYLAVVEQFYIMREIEMGVEPNTLPRRLFVATDEGEVVKEVET